MARPTKSTTDRLLEVVCEPNWTLDDLKRKLKMPLERLLMFVAREDVRALLQTMRYLIDYRSQLAISQHRITAVSRLIDLINEPDFADGDREILRRACAELLRTKVISEPTAGELSRVMDTATEAVSDIEILAALHRIGGRPNEPEADGPPPLQLVDDADVIDAEVVQ